VIRPTRSQRFAPREQCAIAPAAFGLLFELAEPEACETRDGVAIVRIHGPLMRSGGWWFDSYEDILSRVSAALATKPKAVMLAIDSPGGVVAGCFETARELRAMAAKAEVPLVAFTDGQTASAAYALATAAGRIFTTPSSTLGSIGVIDALCDVTAMDEQLGIRFEFVTSGARKADGQPHVKIAPEAVKATQTRVDELAAQFFELVAEHRPLTAQAAKDLEAALVHGGQAVRLRLADELVQTFDQALAVASGGETAMDPKSNPKAGSDYEDGVAKLRKAAEGDDEEAKKAKKMLAAMDEDEEKSESDDDEEKDDKEESKSESDDEDDKEESKSAAADARKAAADARAATTELERAQLLATRPDLTSEQRAAFATTPIANLRAILPTIPKAAVPKPAAAVTPAATRGEGQDDGGTSRLPPAEKRALDEQMGLVATQPGVKNEANKLILGAPLPLTEKKGA
jgi:signal peptide peptidase SppA